MAKSTKRLSSLRRETGSSDGSYKRKRPEHYEPPPKLSNVDVHGILFAVVAVVFVVYPLMQWALGR